MEIPTKAVIFSVDDGKELKSKKPVALHKLLDKTVLEYIADTVKKSGINSICVITQDVRHGFENIAKDKNIFIANQGENSSTAQSFSVPEGFFEDCGYLVLLSSDILVIQPEILSELVSEHTKNGKMLSCVTSYQPSVGFFEAASHIVKYEPAASGQRATPQIFCITMSELNARLKSGTFSQNMFYDLAEELQKSENVSYYAVRDTNTLFKIKNRMDLIFANKALNLKSVHCHINNGVTVLQPETTYIGADVEIGMDTVIYPGVSLEGNTKIGENCVIGYNSRIVNSTISDETEVFYSTILDSFVGSKTHIGPYAYIRPNSKIGSNVKIGDFVEIKNARIGDNTKVSHLTYVGDAEVGKDVNFGCGTVVVNYDGEKKYITKIGDKAFIGCNTNLVSPVEVGRNAFIAAGSTITDYVPEDSLAIARSHQTNKQGWRLKKRDKNK